MRKLFEVDAGALARAKRRSRKEFDQVVREHRDAGFTDREMVDAMIKSPAVIDRLGSTPRPRKT
jgi:hypothetical protein